jgi:DNA-binding IclR family transcriptional regulator
MSISGLSPSQESSGPPLAVGGEAVYTAPALEKGLDILELLASEAEGLLQGVIAQRLGRSTPELFRMLSVLERRGYLNRHADGTYRISLRLFELAHQHPPLKHLLTVALPIMQELAEATRQSAHLVIHYARRILIVAQVDSPEPMGFGVRLGANFPFRPDRASSRVLSAFQPVAVQDELIAELIANSSAQLAASKVRAEMAAIVKNGFYMAQSETTNGVTDLCCPIFDHGGGAVAALTLPYLHQRDVRIPLDSARESLVSATNQISAKLGARADRRE